MSFVRATDRLSIAALPDSLTAHDLSELAWHLRDVHRLTGRPLLPQQMRSTLWHVHDGFLPPSAERIEGVIQRLSGADMPSFRVSFDHAVSSSGGAFVLGGREGVAGLATLNEQIRSALFVDGMTGAPSASPSTFKPYVALLRDPRPVSRHELASPIEWEVTELLLVHSRLGSMSHPPVARLPLKRRDGN